MKKTIVLILTLCGGLLFADTGFRNNIRLLDDIQELSNQDARDYLLLERFGQSFETPGFMILPLEFYTSVNSAYPNGAYDSGLWQGRGLNTQVQSGIKFNSPYLEVTLYPEFNFSQNAYFELLESRYDTYEYGDVYKDIDHPQRYGNDPVIKAHWGQSEVRVKWKTLSLGFGTQSWWSGMANFSPLLVSNEASGYPMVDIGLDKTVTPYGDFEFRSWGGLLAESEFYDDNPDNNWRLLTGASASYRPPFWRDLTVGINRTIVSSIDKLDTDFYWELFDFNLSTGRYVNDDPSLGFDAKDQRASVMFSADFPDSALRLYGELARNDSFASVRRTFQTPWQSSAYNIGAEKSFDMTNGFEAYLNVEWANTWMTRDYFLKGNVSPGQFYSHVHVKQGYTNDGQILGSFIGSGSDYQVLDFRVLAPTDYSLGLRIQRWTRNDDYVYVLIPNADKGIMDVEALFALYGDYQWSDLNVFAEAGWGHNFSRNYVFANDVDNFYLKLGLVKEF